MRGTPRARIDRVIADEERTYGRLLELRDLFRAITGELDSPTASCRTQYMSMLRKLLLAHKAPGAMQGQKVSLSRNS